MSSTEPTARALWYIGDGKAEIRQETLPRPGAGDALVRTLWRRHQPGHRKTGASRRWCPRPSTSACAARTWRGGFPHPVKYGYCAVGHVEKGPQELVGKTVFILHPHQDQIVVPAATLLGCA